LSRNSLARRIIVPYSHRPHRPPCEISRARLLRIAPVLIVT
jgi:hypothetical protein